MDTTRADVRATTTVRRRRLQVLLFKHLHVSVASLTWGTGIAKIIFLTNKKKQKKKKKKQQQQQNIFLTNE